MAVATEAFESASGIEDHCGVGLTSRRLLRRALVIYACLAVVGLYPTWASLSPAWQAGGLGLVWPGGGFAALGGWHYLSFALAMLLAVVAGVLWMLMGNLFAPMFVWLGSAALAAWLATRRVSLDPLAAALVPGLAVLTLAALWARQRRVVGEELQRRAQRNAYLPRATREVLQRAVAAPAAADRELDADALAQLRYAIDRGLQPVESFAGFDVIEQFQTSALRYQIDYLLWGLQLAQCHYTPNFHGYLSQAQRNLIDKLTQPKVWKFWRWESLLGNFSLNRDPIARDNIMFGGFSSANVALYTANTGDRRYLEEGSLTFRENGRRVYRHSLRSMLSAGARNRDSAVYGPLYPCEPKLTYSACNLWGNFAALVSDRIDRTQLRGALIAQLRDAHLREMLCRDGSVHAGRVTPLGIRIPVYTCNFVFALWGWMASAFFPDLSRRVWAILREECISFGANGEITIAAEKYDQIDTGNYRKGEGGLYAHFLILAREHGDEQVSEAIVRKLDRQFGRRDADGVLSYDTMSNLNNATVLMGRLLRAADLRRLFLDGPGEAALRGPVLADAAYPQVLVARAISDGNDLQLVLRAGAGATRQTLRVERLKPGQSYRLVGTGMAERSIHADPSGSASFDVELGDRLELRLAPV